MQTSSEKSSTAKCLRFVRGLVCNSKKLKFFEIVCQQTDLINMFGTKVRQELDGSPKTLSKSKGSQKQKQNKNSKVVTLSLEGGSMS